MVSGPSTAAIPPRCGTFLGNRSRGTAIPGRAGATWRRLASLHDSLFFGTRGEGRAVRHACSAADVRCREAELARSDVAGNAMELVLQLCAIPGVSRRSSRMGHLSGVGESYMDEFLAAW